MRLMSKILARAHAISRLANVTSRVAAMRAVRPTIRECLVVIPGIISTPSELHCFADQSRCILFALAPLP